MKRLCITYHMSKIIGNASDWPRVTDTAETCITISMLDEIADDILEKQADSQYNPTILLDQLARIQGYPTAAFVTAMLVK